MEANRLKDHLVHFCVSKWRSKGSLMTTIQEAVSKASHFSFDPEPRGQPLEQDGEVIFMKNSQSYIWVPYDDSSPSSDPKIRKWGQELDQYILNNPSVVHSLDALLDEDIEAFGLDIFSDDSKPVANMNRHEKIRLLAKCYLMTYEEVLPPDLVLNELKMAIVRINCEDKVTLEWVKGKTYCSHDAFMTWIETVAEPQRPAVSSWRLHDSINRESKPREPMTLQETEEDLKSVVTSWQREARLTEEERTAWSLRLAKTHAAQNQAYKLIEGKWCSFKTPEDFKNLLQAAKDPLVRPIFIRTWLLNEARRGFMRPGTM